MNTKDEALKQALEALEEIHPGNMTPMAEKTWDTAITALRRALAQKDCDCFAIALDAANRTKEACINATGKKKNIEAYVNAIQIAHNTAGTDFDTLAQKDEQALHAGAAVPSEAISLSGDAKLAHDQCRAVAHLANSFAEVYAARAAIVAHDAELSDLIGDASASAMEWLGDELNAMDAATEDDGWLDPIFEAAQKRWPQQPPRRPQKDEQEPDYKALWKQMCERCDYLDKIAHELQTLCDVQALRLGEHENRKPLTDEQIKGLIEEGVFFGNCKEIVRAIEAAHGISIKGGQHGTE